MLRFYSHMDNLLENHIDAPIKKAVAGLALLGLNPYMSCCGFSYKDEVVPKTHLKKAYVYLSVSKKQEDAADFSKWAQVVTALSSLSGWHISPLNQSEDELYFDFYANTWNKGHPWEEQNAVHYYETFVLAIFKLNQAIEKMSYLFKDRVILEDGNKKYSKLSSFWQYEPTESWLITPEIWAKIPS